MKYLFLLLISMGFGSGFTYSASFTVSVGQDRKITFELENEENVLDLRFKLSSILQKPVSTILLRHADQVLENETLLQSLVEEPTASFCRHKTKFESLSELLGREFAKLPLEFSKGLKAYYRSIGARNDDAIIGWKDNAPYTRVQLLYRIPSLKPHLPLLDKRAPAYYKLKTDEENWKNVSEQERKEILKDMFCAQN